jgi:hypothetical protein
MSTAGFQLFSEAVAGSAELRGRIIFVLTSMTIKVLIPVESYV